MSWVESGYISHPTTDNQFSIDDSSFDVRDREIYNVSAMFDDTMTIRVSLESMIITDMTLYDNIKCLFDFAVANKLY